MARLVNFLFTLTKYKTTVTKVKKCLFWLTASCTSIYYIMENIIALRVFPGSRHVWHGLFILQQEGLGAVWSWHNFQYPLPMTPSCQPIKSHNSSTASTIHSQLQNQIQTHKTVDAMLHSNKTISPCISKILVVVDDTTLRKAKCKIGELGLQPPACHVSPNLLSLNFYALEKLHS